MSMQSCRLPHAHPHGPLPFPFPSPDVVEALRALDSGMHAVREELQLERAAASETTAAPAAAAGAEPGAAPAPAPGAEFVSVLEGFLAEATARQAAHTRSATAGARHAWQQRVPRRGCVAAGAQASTGVPAGSARAATTQRPRVGCVVTRTG